MRSRWSRFPTKKQVRVADYITVTAATKMCIPQLDGVERDYNAGWYEMPYPSANHWGQWLFFYTPGQAGVLIRAVDPKCALQLWRLNTTLDRVEVLFFSEADQLVIDVLPPDPYQALTVYRNWASQQEWWPTPGGDATALEIMGLDAYTGNSGVPTKAFLDSFPTKKRSVWATGWRDASFDVDYPRFVARGDAAAVFDEYETTYDAPVFPYFNPCNVDSRLSRWPFLNPSLMAVQKEGGSRYYNLQWDSRPDTPTAPNFLMWYCMANRVVHDQIMEQYLMLRTASGAVTRGFYLDVACSATPGATKQSFGEHSPCWAHNHEHEPGDPYAHLNGTVELIRRLKSTGAIIMAEQVSEPFLKHIDLNLMWQITNPSTLRRPYWTFLYGHAKKDCAWPMPYGSEDDAAVLAEITLADTTYGRAMHGTPSNHSEFYTLVLDGNHPNSLARLGVTVVVPPAVYEAFMLEDGTSILMEDDNPIQAEMAVSSTADWLQFDDNSFLYMEDGATPITVG